MSQLPADSHRLGPQAIAFAAAGDVSRRPRAARWLVALAIVAIAHLIVGGWVQRHRLFSHDTQSVNVPVQIALLTPQRIERSAGGANAGPAQASAQSTHTAGQPDGAGRHDALRAFTPTDAASTRHPPPESAPATSAQRPRPAATHADRASADRKPAATLKPSATRAIPPPGHAVAPARVQGNDAATRAGPAAASALNDGADAAASSASAANNAPVGASAATTGTASSGLGGAGTQPAHAPGEKFALPPAADVQYDTFYNGVRNQAGTLRWATDGEHYQMVVSISLPFVGTYSYTSEGRIDAFGLAPEHYIEQRGHRGTDTTRFQRDPAGARITFTRTPQTVPLSDGAQDRFSMVMQLASLVRGNPAAYRPGVTRQFFVADNDSGEIWPIEMVGTEAVQTARGFVEAGHFTRLPRRDGDHRRIDVWLAPSLGYLPVRLVQTEPNGTQVELLWHGKLPAEGMAGTPPDTAAGAPLPQAAAAPGSDASGAMPAASLSGASGMSAAESLPDKGFGRP